jgi:hypothetical protein
MADTHIVGLRIVGLFFAGLLHPDAYYRRPFPTPIEE